MNLQSHERKMILTFFILYLAKGISANCPVFTTLNSTRTIDTDATRSSYSECVTIDTAHVCYTSEFSGYRNWKLAIVISEQEYIDSLYGNESLPYFPGTGVVAKNTCMKIKTPTICFMGKNPFNSDDNDHWVFASESLFLKRIKTSSGFFTKLRRYMYDGSHYADVTGKVCLSWKFRKTPHFDKDEYWHSVFQLTKRYDRPGSTFGPLRYGMTRNDKNICFEIENSLRFIFSEHPDDVLLWDLKNALMLRSTNEKSKYIDANSKVVPKKNVTSFFNLNAKVCITNTESSSTENYIASINLNFQNAGPFASSSQELQTNCLPATIKQLSFNDIVGTSIAEDSNSIHGATQTLNTLYFVSRDKQIGYNSLNNPKYFCNKFQEATICLNTKTFEFQMNTSELLTTFHFHPSLYVPPYKNVTSDIHRCIKTCPFEACFTENNSGQPWVLVSTMYFKINP
jgi:hypothetical protein